ncbi:MAG TPA: hypothetical protein VHL79_14550 [Ramlibacter sp.]|jgi:hypothetical protein|nr:hypothetical protein [Ramlibacter sp.]
MSTSSLSEVLPASAEAQLAAAAALRNVPACNECQGSGGWFRYEPALDPAPGLLYLSCVHCRGSGRTGQLQA